MELTSTRSTRTLPLLTRRTPKKRSTNFDVPSSFGTEAVSLIELYASEQKPVYELSDANISRREFNYLPMEQGPQIESRGLPQALASWMLSLRLHARKRRQLRRPPIRPRLRQRSLTEDYRRRTEE